MKPFVPRPHQALAAKFLLDNKRCMLAAVPGLGKTGTVYMLLETLRMLGSAFFPALVIAPLKVCELTWPAEQKKWDRFQHLKVVTILGEREVREDALMERADVYVINYDNVQWLVKHLGKRWPFKIVIADESTRLKSYRGSQQVSVKGKEFVRKAGGERARILGDIAMHTGRWINLTGTPAPNGLKDLWGQMWFIDFGERLGRTYSAFMERWFRIDPYTREVKPLPHAEAEIHAAVADVMLAMRAEDWMDVRAPNEITREVELPLAARKLYNEMERTFFAELASGKEVSAVNSAVKSSKLLQIASGAVYDADRVSHHLHDAKVEGLKSIVNELGGEPLLLAYWFKFELPMLKKAFPEMRIFEGAKDEADWNAGRIPLMAVHPASAGHGVNLQHGGRAMCHFTLNWDLELRQQISERIGPVRQKQAGFDRAVLHYNLIAKDTLDQEVYDRLTSKASVQESLMKARAARG